MPLAWFRANLGSKVRISWRKEKYRVLYCSFYFLYFAALGGAVPTPVQDRQLRWIHTVFKVYEPYSKIYSKLSLRIYLSAFWLPSYGSRNALLLLSIIEIIPTWNWISVYNTHLTTFILFLCIPTLATRDRYMKRGGFRTSSWRIVSHDRASTGT